MNTFKKLFKKKAGDENTTIAAIAKLREMENLLSKKQEYLEVRIKQQLDIARAKGRTNKKAALQALKRKRRLEQQLQQVDGTLSTLEMQREALEAASTNTHVLATMKTAADALKNAHLKFKVEDVHDIIDEIAEQQTLAKEIADATASPWDASLDIDEDELLKELEEIDQQELDSKLLETVVPTHDFPPVPTTQLAGSSKSSRLSDDTEDDLKRLKEWASG